MFPTPKRALVVIAHPDDAEHGAAGTVAKWVREGCEVNYVQCTDGGKGTSRRDITSEQLAAIRATEQRRACDALGVKELVLLGYPDGELSENQQFLRDIVAQVRRFRPDTVLAPEFFRLDSWHRDHRVTGRVVADACFPFARDHLEFPELLAQGLEPWKVAHLLMWAPHQVDEAVDISDTVDLKLQALKAHWSQVGENWERVEVRVRERAQDHAQRLGCKYAEIFRRIDFRV